MNDLLVSDTIKDDIGIEDHSSIPTLFIAASFGIKNLQDSEDTYPVVGSFKAMRQGKTIIDVELECSLDNLLLGVWEAFDLNKATVQNVEIIKNADTIFSLNVIDGTIKDMTITDVDVVKQTCLFSVRFRR